MSDDESRKGHCWAYFHRWSRWEYADNSRGFLGYQIKTCLRCGRARGRWVG